MLMRDQSHVKDVLSCDVMRNHNFTDPTEAGLAFRIARHGCDGHDEKQFELQVK